MKVRYLSIFMDKKVRRGGGIEESDGIYVSWGYSCVGDPAGNPARMGLGCSHNPRGWRLDRVV